MILKHGQVLTRTFMQSVMVSTLEKFVRKTS